MKVSVNLTIVRTSADGSPFPTVGYLNVYKTTDGRILTGKKAYSSSGEASRKSRPGAGWQYLGVVRIEEYLSALSMQDLEAFAKAEVIRRMDERLLALTGHAEVPTAAVPDVTPTEPVDESVPVEAVSKPKKATKPKPKGKTTTAKKIAPKASLTPKQVDGKWVVGKKKFDSRAKAREYAKSIR